MAIEHEFNEYLNKTETLTEWACGIDLTLSTHIPTHLTGPECAYRIHEEQKYRSILCEYAINDVFAVSKLSYKINSNNYNVNQYLMMIMIYKTNQNYR